MTLIQQTYAQAVILSGLEDPQQGQLLQFFCRSSVASLKARLRPGLVPEDCRADFVAAAALYALAALSESDRLASVEQLQLGDLTLKKKGKNTAAVCLRNQADMIMAPYCADRFSFRRV